MPVASIPRSVWLACGGLALISFVATCLNWREAVFVARFRASLVSPFPHPAMYALQGVVWYLVAAANILYLAWRSERRRAGVAFAALSLLLSAAIAVLLAYTG